MNVTIGRFTAGLPIPPRMAGKIAELYLDASTKAPEENLAELGRVLQVLDDIESINARRVPRWGHISLVARKPGRELIGFSDTYGPYQVYMLNLLKVANREIRQRLQAARDIRILDHGCGTGVIGLDIAAATGLNVDCTDIDPLAVACTRANALLRGVAHLIDAWQSDGLSNVNGKYDFIVYNAPLPFEFDNDEAATEDYQGRNLKRILCQVPLHLRKGGRLLLMSREDISSYMPPTLRSTIAQPFFVDGDAHAIHRITMG